jgi:cytochrome P450
MMVQILENGDTLLNKLQSAVKKEIFNPIFLNFPFLDSFPIPGRIKARALVKRFSDELANGLLKSHEGKPRSMDSDKLGSRLLAARANGLLTEKELHDNLNVTFVAGQENPQLLLTSIMYLLGKHTVSI